MWSKEKTGADRGGGEARPIMQMSWRPKRKTHKGPCVENNYLTGSFEEKRSASSRRKRKWGSSRWFHRFQLIDEGCLFLKIIISVNFNGICCNYISLDSSLNALSNAFWVEIDQNKIWVANLRWTIETLEMSTLPRSFSWICGHAFRPTSTPSKPKL